MLGGQLVNAVNVDRRATVLLVKRQVQRFAVYLPRTGVDDLYVRIEIAARFQQGKLRLTVQLKIMLRKQHRIQMAHVRRQVENIVHAADQMVDNRRVAHIRDMQRDPILDVLDIKKIAALVGHQRVKQINFDIADLDQAARKIAANETKAAGNEHRALSIGIVDTGCR